MCIAIVKKEGATISDEYLENCFDNNKDGAGLAYAKDGKLYYVKGIFDKKKFIKAVRDAEKVAQGAMLIHCRIGTSGLKDKNNCHPHVVNKHTVLIHNGILSVNVPANSKVSDTVVYIDEYLKDLPEDFMNNEPICKLIEKSIGSYNKFALLNNKGEYKIINESAGQWKDNVWYSNTSYSYAKTYYNTPVSKWSKEDYKDYWNSWVKNKNKNISNKVQVQGTLPLKGIQKITTKSNKFAYPVFDAEKALKQIQSLSDFEILDIGEYPVYDMYKQRFMKESDVTLADDERYRYLDDLDEMLYEEYLYEVQMRGLINEFEGDEGTNSKYRVG